MLLERKRKILATYETKHVRKLAADEFRDAAKKLTPPAKLAEPFRRAVQGGATRRPRRRSTSASARTPTRSRSGSSLVVGSLGEKYQVDELAAKYEFTGREKMDVPKALEVKEELEEIDKLLKQLEEAKKTAQLAIIDMEELQKYAEPGDIEGLKALQQQIEDYIREQAEKQGLEGDGDGQVPAHARRRCGCFSRRCSRRIFADLQASRTGRHPDAVTGEGAVEIAQDEGVRVRRLASRRWTSPRAWSTPSCATGRGCR